MGKVEKWVVLGVLGLIVGILVVSLTVDDPLHRENVVMQGGGAGAQGLPRAGETPPIPAAADTGSAATESKPSALMSSSVASAPAESEPAAAVPDAIPAGSILKTVEGLEPSYMPDTRFYTWKAGDTFPALAQRFYGDLARLATLRRVNEGRNDVQPGDRVMIPVFDPDVPVGAAPSTALAAPAVASPANPAATAAKAPAAASDTSAARTHVVKEGESLWIISKKELGAGSRWKEIYDANRDQLSSPEALRTGLKLRVP